ncbi:MAG TPA: endo alpha-1,4 polygalactosaminidase [Iamia sp.]
MRVPRLLVLVATGCLLAGCGSSSDEVWQPSPSDRWHIQYAGSLDVPEGVDVVNLDMEETSSSVIASLQDDGIRVVCYLSAGSWEPYRDDAESFPDEILGEAYEGFEDERWLDIRASSLRPLLTARIERAADKGCDAVDPDNVNGFENETGFPLTADDQLEFNRWLFAEVHDRGMAVGLKNDLAQAAALVDEVEFQVDEECIQYDDCAPLTVFVDAGKPVWSIEYHGTPASVCPTAAELGFATWIKDISLSAGGHECPVP